MLTEHDHQAAIPVDVEWGVGLPWWAQVLFLKIFCDWVTLVSWKFVSECSFVRQLCRLYWRNFSSPKWFSHKTSFKKHLPINGEQRRVENFLLLATFLPSTWRLTNKTNWMLHILDILHGDIGYTTLLGGKSGNNMKLCVCICLSVSPTAGLIAPKRVIQARVHDCPRSLGRDDRFLPHPGRGCDRRRSRCYHLWLT